VTRAAPANPPDGGFCRGLPRGEAGFRRRGGGAVCGGAAPSFWSGRLVRAVHGLGGVTKAGACIEGGLGALGFHPHIPILESSSGIELFWAGFGRFLAPGAHPRAAAAASPHQPLNTCLNQPEASQTGGFVLSVLEQPPRSMHARWGNRCLPFLACQNRVLGFNSYSSGRHADQQKTVRTGAPGKEHAPLR
jgi:hypothetical protein